MWTKRIGSCVVVLSLAAPAWPEITAERITESNAAERLFGGTDADGGVGDWYLSNGVVEAIIDDVGVQEDLPGGVTPPPKQSEAALSGGSILDLGLVGADNDQLNILFSVGGLSSTNFIRYDSIHSSTTASSATITVSGGVLGFDPLLPSQLPVVTEYTVSDQEPYVTLRSSVTNLGETTANLLTGFLDVMPWTTRAIVPFSPLPDRGFHHSALDLNDPLAGLEQPAYAGGAGNVSPADGVIDPENGTPAGEVAYGLIGVEVTFDEDGPGPIPPVVRPANRLFGVSSVDATALGNLPPVLGLVPGGVISYERRFYVGGRNDVASATNAMIAELAQRLGFAIGTLSGDLDALDTPDVAASAIATRTGGPPIEVLPDGSPITQFRTDATGRFSGVVVPTGTYDIEFRAPERDALVVSGVQVTAGADTSVSVPPLSALATLELHVRGRREDPQLPARITIKGRNGTPDPRLAQDFEALVLGAGVPDEDLRPETFGSSLAQANWVFLPRGEGSVQLRPGEYEIFASRGPEYSIARRQVTLRSGSSRRLSFSLRRIVPTPGALAADFHIHSARSLDSSAAPTSRVASFAAEGVEVMVGTDHDFILDYGPVIHEMDLRSHVTSLIGSEATTTVPNPPAFPEAIGHVNAWPLEVDPTARRDGAVEDEYVAPNFLFSRLRRVGAEVIQYNHLRAGVAGLGSLGFFNNFGCSRCANAIDQTCSEDSDCPLSPAPQQCTCVGYQPDRPISESPNDILLDDDVTGSSGVPNPDGFRNIDFDVMEVANGLDVTSYLLLRRDWFSLLNQAHSMTPRGPVPFIPGTGVSDSHRNTLESAGYFRTYVLGLDDRPAELDPEAFNESVKVGRMVATTGPYIEFSVSDGEHEGAGVGETLTPTGTEVILEIRVLASNWIPVEEVRVVANGETLPALIFDEASTPRVRKAPKRPWARSGSRVRRFDHRIALTLQQDTWLVVEAGARLDPFPIPDGFADQIVPGLVPLAFTNPIFVDLEGDGFDPPGLQAGAAGLTVAAGKRP